MTAADVAWWSRLLCDGFFVLQLLLVTGRAMVFDVGKTRQKPLSNKLGVLRAGFKLVILAGYPFWLRPLLTAAIGGAP